MGGQCGLNAVLLYVFSFFPAFGFPKAIHYIYIGIYIYTYICIYVEHESFRIKQQSFAEPQM